MIERDSRILYRFPEHMSELSACERGPQIKWKRHGFGADHQPCLALPFRIMW